MSKCIGILGGFSPESTALYYKHIVRSYLQNHRDHGYPEVAIYSVSAQRFDEWMEIDDWEHVADGVLEGLRELKRARADFAVIASNTMHLIFEQANRAAPLPLISILDTTLHAIEQAGCRKVGLLGSRYTLEKSFYGDNVARRGIGALIPHQTDREEIQRIISEELSIGLVTELSRLRCRGVIQKLVKRGAQAVVLASTELSLLVRPEDTAVPLFDTAILHACEALRVATSV